VISLGVIGLGTMGANLARNAARHGAEVAVYNRTTEKTAKFMKEHGSEGKFIPCKTFEDLLAALKPPRAILIMVKAGDAVDAVIEEPLSPGDILIDGGNSHYKDTGRRIQELQKKGIYFIGMGVSGGESGALNGPSMMPGGSEEGYRIIKPLLTKMAADDGDGGKCITYCGPDGAGHFVKMVHNGIEYAIMQCIAESYDILKRVGKYSNAKLAELFTEWNNNDPELRSFLIEITGKIFQKKDSETGNDLIDMILDKAAQKGTGKWTTEAAMNYGFPIPTITAAVDARNLSGCIDCRAGWRTMPNETLDTPTPEHFTDHVKSALTLASIVSYMQGITLIAYASQEEGWNIDLGEVVRIWRGGCIIRSTLLPTLQKAYGSGKDMEKGLKEIHKHFEEEAQQSWRTVVAHGIAHGVPLPALSASLAFYDSMRAEHLPQNLIQAQRDFFGAHTYERIDKEGTFHTEWE